MAPVIGYLPPFDVLKSGLQISGDGERVTLSRALFNRLLEAAAVCATFDDVWYRTEFPDVADAVASGAFADELDHFVNNGYAEGRALAYFEVDEEWYLRAYPDVARAVADGDVPDAETHFNTVGYLEGRVADEAMAVQAERWQRAIAASADVIGAASAFDGDRGSE